MFKLSSQLLIAIFAVLFALLIVREYSDVVADGLADVTDGLADVIDTYKKPQTTDLSKVKCYELTDDMIGVTFDNIFGEIEVLDAWDPKKIEHTATRVTCSYSVKLNKSDLFNRMEFSIYEERGKMWNEWKPGKDSFQIIKE